MSQPNATPHSEKAVDTSAALHSLCVSRVPIFNHLPYEELVAITEKATMRVYESGQFVHRSGERSDQLFIVHKGKVKVYRLSKTGREQLVRVLLPGDFSGELALFSDSQHDSYAEVVETSHICTMSRSDLHQLLLQHPTIALHVLKEVSTRLKMSENQTTAIATESINTRIAQYLADLAEQENADTFNLPISRKDLASYLGTTPETLSRRLGEFEQAGLIQQTGQRKMRILDLDALLLL